MTVVISVSCLKITDHSTLSKTQLPFESLALGLLFKTNMFRPLDVDPTHYFCFQSMPAALTPFSLSTGLLYKLNRFS